MGRTEKIPSLEQSERKSMPAHERVVRREKSLDEEYEVRAL